MRSLWGSPFTDWAVLDVVQTSARGVGGGVCCFGISGRLRKLMFLLVNSQLVYFLGEYWMVVNVFVLVFMVQMQTNIGLLCGMSYQGCVFDGPWLGYYLETSTSLDILVRGLAVTLSA